MTLVGPPQKPSSEALSAREVTAILGMMYSAPIIYTPIRMFEVASTSAWIAGLLSGVVGAGTVYIWTRLSASFPRQTLPEFVPRIVGPYVGWAVNLMFLTYFVYEVAISTRMISEVVVQVLPETPIGVIMAMSLVTGALVTRLGPEVLGRMATIHLGIALTGFLFMVVALAPLVQLRNFQPFLVGGWFPVLQATTPPASLFSHITLISFLLPLVPLDPPDENAVQTRFRQGMKVGMIGIGISWLLFFLLLVLAQGVFSADETARLAIPAFSLARAIDFGVFFERVEVSLLALWLPAVLIKTCTFLYVASLTLGHLAATPSYRRYVLPLAGMTLPAAYTLASNLPELIRLVNGAWVIIAIGVKVLLPLLLLILHLVRGRVSSAF